MPFYYHYGEHTDKQTNFTVYIFLIIVIIFFLSLTNMPQLRQHFRSVNAITSATFETLPGFISSLTFLFLNTVHFFSSQTKIISHQLIMVRGYI